MLLSAVEISENLVQPPLRGVKQQLTFSLYTHNIKHHGVEREIELHQDF